jgi:hypothetical protein
LQALAAGRATPGTHRQAPGAITSADGLGLGRGGGRGGIINPLAPTRSPCGVINPLALTRSVVWEVRCVEYAMSFNSETQTRDQI